MASALPLPKQLHNSDSLTRATSVSDLLEQSFMQPCYYGALYIDDPISNTLSICDHAVLMDDKLLLIVEKHINVTHQAGITKQLITQSRRDAIYAAHHQLTDAVNHVHASDTTLYTDQAGTQIIDIPDNIHCYLLCITDINIVHGEKRLNFTHHYGSDYFVEECVLDFDNEDHATQMFSLENIANVIDTLYNMPDFGCFLAAHKTYLVSGSSFENELEVLADFIETGEMLVSARDIETDLIRAGMREGMDPKLAVADSGEQTKQFLTMRENAKFWNQLITMYASQVPPEQMTQESAYRTLLLALMNESIYSRNSLVKAIADYTQSSAAQKSEGYVLHLRSYSHASRHYALLFYASDSAHPNYRTEAKNRLNNLATAVNLYAQQPPLQEIIVIGMEDNNGSMGVDMYYMPGSEISPDAHEEAFAAMRAQQQAQQQLKGHSAVDFSTANNMAKDQSKVGERTKVRPIDEKNDAAKRYDDMQAAPKSNRARPQPLSRRSGIKKLKVNQGQPKLTSNKVSSRNAPCPCGSGKKFRHCHGAQIDYSA